MKISALILVAVLSSVLAGCTGIVIGGVATGISIVHDRRDTGTIFKDKELEWKIGQAIYAIKELNTDSHINITVYNKSVLLSGETPAEDLKLRANALATKAGNVRRVFDELTIGPPSSLLSRSNDTYITAKVKLSLLDVPIEELDLTHIKIVTENSAVYMFGLVTEEEAERATNLARRVAGVSKVIKLFEYIEKKPPVARN